MCNRKKRAFARISMALAVGAMLAVPQAALARFGDATLSTGSTGHDVRVLQSWLDKLGFHTGIDGQFGRHTRWAVRRFEQSKRLQVNGVVTTDDAQVLRSQIQRRFGSDSNSGSN